MSVISTHVLDTSVGKPAVGIAVRLEMDGLVAEGVTDADGRCRFSEDCTAGTYRLTFATQAYLGDAAFYPEVQIVFVVAEGQKYHVPLLLNPFGYSTYRGS